MATWTASTTMHAEPDDVLAVLTDPGACARWAPIPFALDRIDHDRLVAGCHAHVSGSLAGQRLGFDVRVFAADEDGLELTASGLVDIDVAYALRPAPGGSEVHASVSVHGSGLTGRLLARATDALLAAGALHHAVAQIAREAETTPMALVA
jgi:hypothetical protein